MLDEMHYLTIRHNTGRVELTSFNSRSALEAYQQAKDYLTERFTHEGMIFELRNFGASKQLAAFDGQSFTAVLL